MHDPQPVDATEPAIADPALARIESSRRRFLVHLAVGAAVATPVVSSFSLNGLSPSYNLAFGASNQSFPPPDDPGVTTTTMSNMSNGSNGRR